MVAEGEVDSHGVGWWGGEAVRRLTERWQGGKVSKWHWDGIRIRVVTAVTHPIAIIGVPEALELLVPDDADDPSSSTAVGLVVGSSVGGPASGYT